MAKLFSVLAGKSEDTFAIGGVDFYAAPLTIAEWTQMQVLEEEGRLNAELLTYLASKLQARVKEPTKNPPSEVTSRWLEVNLPREKLSVLQYVLMYGRMPEVSDGKPQGR